LNEFATAWYMLFSSRVIELWLGLVFDWFFMHTYLYYFPLSLSVTRSLKGRVDAAPGCFWGWRQFL